MLTMKEIYAFQQFPQILNKYELLMFIKYNPSTLGSEVRERYYFWRSFFEKIGSPIKVFSYGIKPLMYPLYLKDTYGKKDFEEHIDNMLKLNNTVIMTSEPVERTESPTVANRASMLKIIFYGSSVLLSTLENELKKDTLVLRWVVKKV